MNKENYAVLTNIIAAVESGGQVYGNKRYDAYAGAHTNSDLEKTCTLGYGQFYGDEAEQLIKMIKAADEALFKSIDKSGTIAKKLSVNWVSAQWDPNSTEKALLIALITTDVGKKCQDELMVERLQKYIAKGEEYGVHNVHGLMFWAEIEHLGGLAPTKRVFDRCGGKFECEDVMAALLKDQKATGSNSVSAKKYWTRHVKCNEFILTYAQEEGEMATTIVDEFSKYIGTTEYNGIVATIQKWYYGSLVKDAWCATSTSYFANVAGILSQIGGKHEGVSEMMAATKKLHKSDGRFWEYGNIPKQLKKHDIVFFKRNGSSHVAHCWQDCTYTGSGYINVLGGNQSDMICKKDYKQANIQAVYRPDYGTAPTPTPSGDKFSLEVGNVFKGCPDSNIVYTLRSILRGRNMKDRNGDLLKVSRTCDDDLIAAINCYQEARRKQGVELGTDGKNDGCAGRKFWNDISGGLVK